MLNLTQPAKIYNFICIVIYDILKIKVNIKTGSNNSRITNLGLKRFDQVDESEENGKGPTAV